MSTGWELLLGSCVSARASAIADHTPSGDGVSLLYQVAADEVRNGRSVILVSAVNDAPHHLAVLKKMVGCSCRLKSEHISCSISRVLVTKHCSIMQSIALVLLLQGVPLDVIRDKLRLVLPVPALPPLAGSEPSPLSHVDEDAQLFFGVRAFARGWLASGLSGGSALGDRLLTLVRRLVIELGCSSPASGKPAGAGASTPGTAAAAATVATTVTILVDDSSALASVCAASHTDPREGVQAVRSLIAMASHADAAAAGMVASAAVAAAAGHGSSVYSLPVARPGAAAAAEAADTGLPSARSSAASDAASGSSSASLTVPRLAGGLTAPSAAAGALSARRASLSSSSAASLLGGSSPAAVSAAAGEAPAPSSARSSARPSPSAGLAVSSRGTSSGGAVVAAAPRSRPGSARASPAASASPPEPPAHGRSSSSGSGASTGFAGAGAGAGRADATAAASGSGVELRPSGVYIRGSLAATVRCIVRLPMDADVAVGDTTTGFCRVAQLRYLHSLCDAIATFACLPSGHSKDVHGRVTVTRRPVSYTCSADVSSNGGTGTTFSGMLPVAALPAGLAAPGALATYAWAVAPPLSSLYRIADSSCRLQAVGECSFA